LGERISKRIGKQTVRIERPISILSCGSVAGSKEGQGPLGGRFDIVLEDDKNNEKSWEKAESSMVENAIKTAINKAGMTADDMDYILAGDLLDQSIGSTFGIRAIDRPFIGLFGACSTFGESVAVGAMLIDGGFAKRVVAAASSHFCAAERQFRFPLELGTQRPPTSTWTVTGCGAAVLGNADNAPFIREITMGKIVDMGIKDANNMGAAMVPAAADTLLAHFRDTGRNPRDYDLIVTGDLGYVGKELLIEIVGNEGFDISKNYTDCGIEIFDRDTQGTDSGGSGCGCSAVTFAARFYDDLKSGRLKRILFMPTGALMSKTSAQQGESIPGIAHCMAISHE